MKRILLAVCGKTPQIITETLFALWDKGEFPQAIKILTTKAGKEAIYTKLLDPSHGVFYKFCEEYGINADDVAFSWQDILVPRVNGVEIEDILTEEDSFAFLQAVLEQAFYFTGNPDTAVYFSLAAGRKTMGASLTLAAQIYGRSQDKLYHVLVHSDFEYSPYFYYPPKQPKTIELVNSAGEKYYKSTEYAKISLVTIPFFSVREKFNPKMLEKPFMPQELMALLDKTEEPKLKLYIRSCKMEWQGKSITLPVAWFTLYVFFVLRKKRSQDNENCNLDILEIENCKEEIASLYHKIIQFMPKKEITQSDTGIIALTAENIRSYRSKVNTKIQKNFGQLSSDKLCIGSFGQKPNTKYGLSLASHLIEIIDEVGEKWD